MREATDLLQKLHSNAMRGNWSEILKMYRNKSALRTEKITATGDTLLHMAVSNRQVEVVENMVDLLLDQEDDSVVITMEGDGEVNRNVNNVLGAENDEKNIPLHLAAKRGNVNMCMKIGGKDPLLIARRNIMGETPLFLAALSGHKEAFLCLHYLYASNHGASSIGFAHCVRDNDDTILHCAIAQEHIGVAIEIVYLYKDHMQEMMKCNKEGFSPLHLLASKPSAFASTTLPELPILLRFIYRLWIVKEKHNATTSDELKQEQNKKDFSLMLAGICCLPLLSIVLVEVLLLPILFSFSKAVYERWLHNIPKMKKRHTQWRQIMTKLLEHVSQHASDEDMSQIISRNASEQRSMSLQTMEDNGKNKKDSEGESRATTTSGAITTDETPLIIAVKNGAVEMVEKILELFPLTIKDVNADGKNIFLLAAEYRQIEVLRFLCKQEWLTERLFGQVDNDGNNALHLVAGLGVIESDWLKPGEALSMLQEISWFQVVEAAMPSDMWGKYNQKMETPVDIFKESHKEIKKREDEWVAKTSQACSVVSTLVVSVAFATRTSVPGGYEGDNGYAILRNKPQAFKTFRDSSFAALFFSLISTICFLSIVASRSQSAHSLGYAPSKFYYGVYFMFGSIVCLWISFCAADFFILHDGTQKLHKALPTYIWLTCGVILMVFLQLPIFVRPRFSTVPAISFSRAPRLRVPGLSSKATRLIEYRKAKNNENGTDLNHQN